MNDNNALCPGCGKTIPKDSEFCQFCGVELAKLKDNSFEKIVAEIIINEFFEDAKLIIEKVCLYSIGDERSYIHCYFKSISERTISAILFDIKCFDIFGNELPTVHNSQILDLSVRRNDTFENSKKIFIDNANVRMVKIIIKKVLFIDGSIMECDENSISLNSPIPLDEKLGSIDLAQQFVRDTTPFSKYFPEYKETLWMCSCGCFNTDEEELCNQCQINRKELFELANINLLQERLFEYEAEKETQEIIKAEEARKIELAEQEKQALISAENEIRVRNERDAAILKRMEATRIAERQKKKIIIIIGVIIVILFFVFVFIVTKKTAYNGQLRNFATESMNEDYTNVYADVISIEPVYFVYQYNSTKSGVPIGEGEIWDVVCKCQTVEGKTIWIAVFYQYYPGYDYFKIETDYEKKTYSISNPKRITGTVYTAHQVVSELESKIGNIYVLKVDNEISE